MALGHGRRRSRLPPHYGCLAIPVIVREAFTSQWAPLLSRDGISPRSLDLIERRSANGGPGVVLGSNVFNLAALLGPGAVVGGRINLHRRVVDLGGTVAPIVGVARLLSVGSQVSTGTG